MLWGSLCVPPVGREAFLLHLSWDDNVFYGVPTTGSCVGQPLADAFYTVLEQLGASPDLFQIRKPKLIDIEVGRIC